MKILFVAGGAPATVFALAPLATALRNAGHQVFMASTEEMAPVIASVGLPAVVATTGTIQHFISRERSGEPSEVPTDPIAQMRHTGRWFGRMAAASLDALVELAGDWRPDVVVGGTMSYAAPLLAARLGVPWVKHAWDCTEATGIDPGAAEELRPELAAVGLTGLPEPTLFVDVCPPSLRPAGAGPVQPMRWAPGNSQRRLQRWMYARGTRRRVLVTSGSRVAIVHNVEFLGRLAKSVATLDVELIVAAPDEVAAELRAQLGDIPAGWVPLDVVAPTCDVIVHHAGGVTGLTALNAGVPQLIIPKGANFVAASQRLADAGAAITLLPGDDTVAGVASACEDLMSEPSYAARAQELSAEIAALPTPAEVADVVAGLGGQP